MTDDRTPAYQGRPLPRPGEEVVDQGLGFDLGTLLGRRRVLAALGIGAVTAGLAACGGPGGTTSAGEIPEETAGPFPGDGSNGANVLTESGVVRRDIRSGFGTGGATAEGVLMTLDLTIIDTARAPMAGAAVYVWHCDREGRYSLYSPGVENENYLRGVQVADPAGKVTFASIVPACYPGRWPHVHFEVYPSAAGITDAANAIATSQVAFPRDVCETVYATPGYERSVAALSELSLESDTVFGDDGGALQLATVTGDVTSGYRVALTAVVDTGTAP
ncbi:3,4-dioxygenase subunit beta [Pseudonocardia sp. C8]|uniref:dioxygenase family protein n=1 Tax=Pseudonocardia sp. C8 TaxID=2762759 RepID=UPI0016428432|nr:3,4-dioxygenase subunit beta [Pseudonocardia sp. C8]MBC3190841.1 3,4-dioxygenase subunit beta [Pseudonocardia sp. C8]